LVREKAIMQLLLNDDLTLPEDNPLPVVWGTMPEREEAE
jgi:hypothetical protein